MKVGKASGKAAGKSHLPWSLLGAPVRAALRGKPKVAASKLEAGAQLLGDRANELTNPAAEITHAGSAGDNGDDLRVATAIPRVLDAPSPEGMDWLARHATDYFKEVSLLYELCAEDGAARFKGAGEGFPPRLEYRWMEDGGERTTGPRYVLSVFAWARDLLEDPRVVPDDGGAFPADFVTIISKVFTRLFRVFSILFAHHTEALAAQDAVPYLEQSFRNFMFFVFDHDLVRHKEFRAMPERVEEVMWDYNASCGAGLALWSEAEPTPAGLNSEPSASSLSSPPRNSAAFVNAFSQMDPVLPVTEARARPRRARTTRTLSYMETMSTFLNTTAIELMLERVVAREGGANRYAAVCMSAVRELLQSEIEFGDLVCKLQDEYVVPARSQARLPESALSAMFVGTAEILRFSEFLCSEMHLCLQQISATDAEAGSRRNSRAASATEGPGRDAVMARSAPSCAAVVSAFVERAIQPNLAFFPHLFSGALAGFGEALAQISAWISNSHIFARIVQSKNAKLNTSLPALLETIKDRPAEFANRVLELNAAFASYRAARCSAVPSGRALLQAVLPGRAAATQAANLDDPGCFAALPEHASASPPNASSPLPKAAHKAIRSKAVQKSLSGAAHQVVAMVRAVRSRARAIDDRAAVQAMHPNSKCLAAAAVRFRFGGLKRDQWKSGMAFVFPEVVVLATRVSNAVVGTCALGSFGARSPKTRPRSKSATAALGSGPSSSPQEHSGGMRLLGRRLRSPKRDLAASDIDAPYHHEQLVLEDELYGIEVSTSRAEAASVDSSAVEAIDRISLSFSCPDGLRAPRLVHLKTASFDLAAAIFASAGSQLPPQINTYPFFSALPVASEPLGGADAGRSSAAYRRRAASRDAEEPKCVDVFVCHHPEMAELQAMYTYFELKDRALRPWVEQLAVTPEEVSQVVEGASVVALLLTPGALVQPSVRFQLDVARRAGRAVVVLALESHPIRFAEEKAQCPLELQFLLSRVVTLPSRPAARGPFWDALLARDDVSDALRLRLGSRVTLAATAISRNPLRPERPRRRASAYM